MQKCHHKKSSKSFQHNSSQIKTWRRRWWKRECETVRSEYDIRNGKVLSLKVVENGKWHMYLDGSPLTHMCTNLEREREKEREREREREREMKI